MSTSSKAVDILTKMITETARNVVESASFDKTTFGVIKKKQLRDTLSLLLEKNSTLVRHKTLSFMNGLL